MRQFFVRRVPRCSACSTLYSILFAALTPTWAMVSQSCLAEEDMAPSTFGFSMHWMHDTNHDDHFVSYRSVNRNREVWQNDCDREALVSNLSLYSLCSGGAPVFVLSDELSTKLFNQLKQVTHSMLNTTGLIVIFRWAGVENSLISNPPAPKTGFSIEMEPGIHDAYVHVRYYFQ